jgi:glycosyltransferase involved in cell wall biosynthesis
MKNPVIVIPAYNPGEVLITIVKEIVASVHQSKILIINDGSQSNVLNF